MTGKSGPLSNQIAALPEAVSQSLPQSPEVLTRLDRSLIALRQVIARPVSAELPIPSLGRSVEFAKVVACEAIAGLNASKQRPTVKAVAAVLHIDHSTMSRVLADAEADGLLARTQDPNDRRRTLVELTTDGQSLVRDGQMLRVWFMARVLSDWDPADVEQLTSYFERAVATFEDRFDVVRQESEALLGYDVLPTPTDDGN
jgi:hypothetical protein